MDDTTLPYIGSFGQPLDRLVWSLDYSPEDMRDLDAGMAPDEGPEEAWMEYRETAKEIVIYLHDPRGGTIDARGGWSSPPIWDQSCSGFFEGEYCTGDHASWLEYRVPVTPRMLEEAFDLDPAACYDEDGNLRSEIDESALWGWLVRAAGEHLDDAIIAARSQIGGEEMRRARQAFADAVELIREGEGASVYVGGAFEGDGESALEWGDGRLVWEVPDEYDITMQEAGMSAEDIATVTAFGNEHWE